MTTVDVWLVDSGLPPDLLDTLVDTLDPDELARARGLDLARRAEFIAAHGAARAIVGQVRGVRPADVRWRLGRHGKPETDQVRVSLSRSAGLALVACTSSRAVGVDLQLVAVGDPARVARRFFGQAEACHVGQHADRYTRLLARKEACVKAAGHRLFPGLRTSVLDDEVHRSDGQYRVQDLTAPPGYAAAVALSGDADFRVREHRWPGEMPC